ncbi:MAG: hypothetical protein K2M07_00325 [Muribaculaceae bacterium]|nr:hypothetical protein [Muribaculaceae bacterium]
MVIFTEKFKPAPGLYAGILLRRWLINNLWWLIMPLTLFLALGVLVNGSFFYVAVIYILCVASLSQAIIFFNYALRPDTVVKTFEQEWEFSHAVAKVTYHPTVTVNDERISPLKESVIIEREQINRLSLSGANLIMTVAGDYDIYVIPLSSLKEENVLTKLYEYYETDN